MYFAGLVPRCARTARIPPHSYRAKGWRIQTSESGRRCSIRQRTYGTVSDDSQKQIKRCEFCGTVQALSNHICSSCHAPSPIPETVSYYSYFPNLTSAPPAGPFSINTRALRMQLLKAQQKVHPDNFSTDDKKRLIAESTSSLLNKAYSTLLNPLTRAEYLLESRGLSASAEGDKLTDPELLMTVMEAREDIEAAASEKDLEAVRNDTKERIEIETAKLETAFAADDLSAAKESAVRLRYWLNIQKAARDWEPGQEIVLEH